MNTSNRQPPAHRAWLQPIRGVAAGRVADLADCNGAGTTTCRWLFPIAGLILLLVCLLNAQAQGAPPDVLYLRDGRTLTGNIIGETPEAYRTLLHTSSSPIMTNVSVKAVRYVVYGTPQKARTALRLPETARVLGARDSAKAKFLPTEAFGEASLEAIAAARKRIWILAFYISGGLDPTIDAFYNTLRDKARSGLDVRIISEFSQGTPMPIRNGTANFTHTLLADGIQVGFIQEYRVMHKKVIIIDERVVFLGSSNLTGAGMKTSDEFNVRIECESTARRAAADFLRMARQAKPFEELK